MLISLHERIKEILLISWDAIFRRKVHSLIRDFEELVELAGKNFRNCHYIC